LFTYENDFPLAQVLNRPNDSAQINYEKVKREHLLSDHEVFDGISKFRIDPTVTFPGFLALRDMNALRQIRLDSMEKALFKAESDWAKETILLDSLYKRCLLSKEVFDFFNTKAKAELAFINYEYQHYKERIPLSKESKPLKWPFENADSLAGYAYYNNILEFVEREFFTIDLEPKTINKKTPDYPKAYDVIKENKQLSQKERIILLTRTMESILDNCAESEVKKYLTLFTTDVQNQALQHHVFRTYGEILPDDILTNIQNTKLEFPDYSDFELSLKNVKGENTLLETIMKRYKGKLILLDFWASHCLPCLLAIPQSRKLGTIYKDKGLQIIYISIDENVESWNNASHKLFIDDYSEHYIVDSSRVSPMMKIYNLKAMPRYILFDKNGGLIHKNAPGPGSNEIRELLDKYLADGD
jgi:thiol-disulfide isomerase/thioredoxin